jgi:hypothetical protein
MYVVFAAPPQPGPSLHILISRSESITGNRTFK